MVFSRSATLRAGLTTGLLLSLFWLPIAQASSEASKNITYFPKYTDVSGKRTFIFSPHLMQWAAYDKDGYRVAYGKANGGADFCSDIGEPCRTPEGTFKVFRQKGKDCKSSQFPIHKKGGGAPMPYCMFFKNGSAIHGSMRLSNRNNSHGCIRVKTAAAKWLQEYFIRIGTTVVVLPY